MNMQITEITIYPTNEDLVRAYVSIVFDNCFMVGEIRVMQGPTGLFVSFPAKKQRDGTYLDIAFPANAETRKATSAMWYLPTGVVKPNEWFVSLLIWAAIGLGALGLWVARRWSAS